MKIERHCVRCRFVYLIIATMFFAMLSGCNTLQERPGGSFTSNAEMPEGAVLISEVQGMLAAKNYNPGPIDGVFGNRTSAALKAFQKDNELEVSGQIDNRTYAVLKNATEVSSAQQFGESLGEQFINNLTKAFGLPSHPSSPSPAPTTKRSAAQASEPTENGSRDGRVMTSDGLEPVGPIKKPGCDGIEIVGYAEDPYIGNDTFYYVAIRNNTNVTKLVAIRSIGGRRIDGSPPLRLSETITIKAGDVATWNIDYAVSRPALVSVEKCL